ncbi:MAG TPA: glycosyltransferase [Bacteroidia bacterium]|nr:glycosyltransferase [Bacteroidia bacterium]
MTLSIVIPSYKGADSLRQELPGLISWLKSNVDSFEIIIVDDGSDDKGATEKVVKENNCLFIGLARNTGKGGAVRAGMLSAKGDFRIFTDADIPFELDAFETFLHYLRDKEFQIAVGDRTLPESRYFAQIAGARKIGSNVFTFLVGRFVTTGLFDTQCGMKGFTAKVADDLFSVSRLNSFAFDVELLYIALKRNYDIKRLPVRFRGTQDSSSVSLARHAPGMLADLFRIKLNHMRGLYNRRG